MLERVKDNLTKWRTIEKFSKKRTSIDKGDAAGDNHVGGTKWWKRIRGVAKAEAREKREHVAEDRS